MTIKLETRKALDIFAVETNIIQMWWAIWTESAI